MTAADIVAALQLPATTRVDQRVPKTTLIERSDCTATDKRHIRDGIEELLWVASLKPETVGVPLYRDEEREYLELAVLSLNLRTDAKASRLVELIHRSIPYPVLLITERSSTLSLSGAHIRRSLNEAGRIVLSDTLVAVELPPTTDSSLVLPLLALGGYPAAHLSALYQGWLERIELLAAAQITGRYELANDPAAATARRTALAEHARLTREIVQLPARAERETQLAKRVEYNQEIQRCQAALAAAKQTL
ncbi:MAG: DUF4391 domain-containing protein [Pirellulales bacterium]